MEEIEKFVQFVQAVSDAFYNERFSSLPKPKVTYTVGPTYYKVIMDTSVYCFVRKSDGAIFKAASFKAPDVKTGVRAYLNSYPDQLIGAYGIAYKRGGNYGPTVYPPRP